MVSKYKVKAAFWFQKILLNLSWLYFSNQVKNGGNAKRNYDWVVGTAEVVNLIERIGTVLPSSYTVCLGGTNSLFDLKYNYSSRSNLRSNQRFYERLVKLAEGPLLLGNLLSNCNGLIYVGLEGFLISSLDCRSYEFSFVKKKKRKIVCVLTGTDIRSPLKSIEFSIKHGKETYSEYQIWRDPALATSEYENEKREIAFAIDGFADLIFNWKNDQISYLSSISCPMPYLCQEDYFHKDLEEKFSNQHSLVITHAPSDPIIKGTSVVRAVIQMLRDEGFEFEYLELQRSSNLEVIRNLERTHILINQLYSLSPGILAIEGLAHRCVVLTSADRKYEELGDESEKAWVSITPGTLYKELKYLIENPNQLKIQSDAGWKWALQNASEISGGERFRKLLSTIN